MKISDAYVPVIIPSFEPDERFSALLISLRSYPYGPILVIDDGSGKQYQSIFEKAKSYENVIVLRHATNQGKGAGIKTGMTYILSYMKDVIGGGDS